jgi:hypothetical protein
MSAQEFWGEFGPLFLIVAGGALLVGVSAMLISCVQDCRFLRSYRQGLRERISSLRIHRMLGALGVSRRDYTRKALFSEVEMHLSRCRQCPNTDECDAALDQGDVTDGEAFCPNFRELVKFSRRPTRGRRVPAGHGSN